MDEWKENRERGKKKSILESFAETKVTPGWPKRSLDRLDFLIAALKKHLLCHLPTGLTRALYLDDTEDPD